ncbi:hypothetical protein ALI144C_09495 [Actinosynnema sp. ALI-1.44]|uniref:hypothetical protein n=1 Tax=Actinosynnema sp. ALI-1.44 TaxID=1933779 RepID=UPI00097C184B|nr:hypothetical protein [Actinosynnema sp. ALI-1.44]ONI87604.1 hypothetical protein ALI144C_09495 [Actinosynnema sp. ALI-1.44]
MTTAEPSDRRHRQPAEFSDEAQAGATETRDRAVRQATPENTEQQPGARAEKARAPEAGVAENRAPAEKTNTAEKVRLFEETEAERYRVQWRELQAGFVDEPRATVREAQTLVNHMVESLTTQLENQRQQLHSGADTDDTERLRVVMQRYRSLFDQMLSV